MISHWTTTRPRDIQQATDADDQTGKHHVAGGGTTGGLPPGGGNIFNAEHGASVHYTAGNPQPRVSSGPIIFDGRQPVSRCQLETRPVGVSCEIAAALDQYGDTSVTFDTTGGGDSFVIPPASAPLPDVFFAPFVIPRSEWPANDTPVFGVPRIRANDAVAGACNLDQQQQHGHVYADRNAESAVSRRPAAGGYEHIGGHTAYQPLR